MNTFFLSVIFQLFIEVRDGGVIYQRGRPYLSDTQVLKLIVSRNSFPPQFIPRIYNQTRIEHQETGEDIEIVTLLDQDGDVRFFSNFFYSLAFFTSRPARMAQW